MPIRRRRFLILLVATAIGVHQAGPGLAGEPPAAPPVRQATFAPAPSTMDALAGPAAPGTLDVMTFNLRYATGRTPNSWAQRRPAMRDLLTAERPHLIGTQEGLAGQLRDIGADLGDRYGRLGTGRNGGDRGEHMAVFFDKRRLAAQRSGDFWLSETPSVPGSISWGAHSVRMVTWVLFADLDTGRHFYAVSTHLDSVSENARRHGAALLRDRLGALEPLPVILMGDFNSPAGPGSAVYRLLSGYVDTWTAAARRGPAYATIHNYGRLVPDGWRVDWILTTPGVAVSGALMNPYRRAGQYPSDHVPVQARLSLP